MGSNFCGQGKVKDAQLGRRVKREPYSDASIRRANKVPWQDVMLYHSVFSVPCFFISADTDITDFRMIKWADSSVIITAKI